MQQSNFQDTAQMQGIVTRRLFDTNRYEAILSFLKENPDTPEDIVESMLDWAAKPMFADNAFWRFLKKRFNLDLQIPLITGYWTKSAIKRNTITTVGKQVAASQLNGVTTAPATAIAIGVGTPSSTALGSESTTNGGGRGAATCTNQTTTTTGDTARFAKTFTFTGSLALTEEGIFDNNTSGGNMVASQSFSAVNVVSTDTLTITHDIKMA